MALPPFMTRNVWAYKAGMPMKVGGKAEPPMRELTLVLMFGLVLALAANGCSTDEPPAPAPTEDTANNDGPDQFALYRNVGRTWVIRTVLIEDDGNERISHERFTVVEVNDGGAVFKTEQLDENLQPVEGAPPERTGVTFATPEFPLENDPDLELESIRVDAGEFECRVEQRNDTRRWTAVEFPGLLVRLDAGAVRQELIKFRDVE
jgi:hypothetical protein